MTLEGEKKKKRKLQALIMFLQHKACNIINISIWADIYSRIVIAIRGRRKLSQACSLPHSARSSSALKANK